MTQTIARVFGIVVPARRAPRFRHDPVLARGRAPPGSLPRERAAQPCARHLRRVGPARGRTLAGATAYCRIAGIAYIALAVVGLLAPTGFGLVPLGGHDVWLHAILGIILTAGGFLDRPVPTVARY
jgi:hypothetical protein